MSEPHAVHSAARSAAGYLYQARLALVEALRYAYVDSGIEIAVEKFDDVSFEKSGNALELLQAKHHLKKSGDLSDRSVDLWKTLGVWAEAAKADPSLPGRTRFALVTTAHAPTGSAASYLRPADAGNRDPAKAEAMLVEAGGASRNQVLAKAIAAFKALTPEMRKALVAAIEIIDGAPLIGDIESLIEEGIRMIAPRGQAPLAREQLEGWWWPRICTVLQAERPGTIPVLEVEQKLDDIRDSFKRDALPLDMEHVDPSQQELDSLDEMRFVRQLRSVSVGVRRMQYAKRDFYRASTQRSLWARRNLIFDGEVGHFEKTLIEEWQPRFAQMCHGLSEDCQEADLREAGHNLYHWVETGARFPLRTTISRFLNVGSYHILADDLRVGWHRDYKSLCGDQDEGDPDGG
ncbi:ABC-three component system protein [Candidatus Palauibacter sp.]|uniref:ABC-three component system protein n=1 Tax=Candidatus Palauibacter sp. TaxID=3101350 RepID=UPI003C6F4418